MWKLKTLFWIIVFLLALPTVFSGTQQTLYDDACLIYHPSVNVSIDNSTNARLATINGGVEYITTVKQVGDASAFFDDSTNNPVRFAGAGCLAPKNLTIMFWSNMTQAGLQALQVIFSTRPSTAQAGDYFCNYDTRSAAEIISCGYFDTDGSVISAVLNPATDFFNNHEFELLTFEVNFTLNNVDIYLSINNTVKAKANAAISPVSTIEDFVI